MKVNRHQSLSTHYRFNKIHSMKYKRKVLFRAKLQTGWRHYYFKHSLKYIKMGFLKVLYSIRRHLRVQYSTQVSVTGVLLHHKIQEPIRINDANAYHTTIRHRFVLVLRMHGHIYSGR